MKMRKIKNTKATKFNKPEENEIKVKNIVIAFLIILAFFIVFYGLTIILVKKINKEPTYNINNIEEKENDILMKDILKQKEELYYVLAINDNNKDVYKMYTDNMQTPVYNINFSNALNKNVISTELNIAEDPKDIKINDTVFFIIENNQIKEYYVGLDNIVSYLKEVAF